MTDNQKNAIRAMRTSGAGYKKIAKALNLPVSTVQYYCQKADLTVEATEEYDDTRCRFCGKPLTQMPGVKRRRFCSAECRVKWWTAHPCSSSGHTKASHSVVCQHCGATFTAYGKQQRKYCSHECYVAERFGGSR